MVCGEGRRHAADRPPVGDATHVVPLAHRFPEIRGRPTAPALLPPRTTPLTTDARKPAIEVLEDRLVPSFVPAVPYAAGSFPQAVAVGNFDTGSTLDLVVANYGSSTISVLRGSSGTFQAAELFHRRGPLSMAVGDFNEDGNLDVVTANLSDLSVLLGNGDGTFQTAQSLGIGTKPAVRGRG